VKKVLDEYGNEIGVYDGMFVIIKDKKTYRIDDDGDVFSSDTKYSLNEGSNKEFGVGQIINDECKTGFGQVIFKIVHS